MGFHCQFCQPTPGNGLNTAFHRHRNCQAVFSFFQTTVSRRRRRTYNGMFVQRLLRIYRKLLCTATTTINMAGSLSFQGFPRIWKRHCGCHPTATIAVGTATQKCNQPDRDITKLLSAACRRGKKGDTWRNKNTRWT